MKPFKINRDSWHYKLNKNFFNSYGPGKYSMQDYWEPTHNNFCSYWRATFFRMLFATLLSCIAIMFASTFALVVYHDPIGFGIVVLILIGIILFSAGVVGIQEYFRNMKNKNADKPDSLFVAKYKSYKSKVCPMVEYDK